VGISLAVIVLTNLTIVGLLSTLIYILLKATNRNSNASLGSDEGEYFYFRAIEY
jgi:hypothetical protein